MLGKEEQEQRMEQDYEAQAQQQQQAEQQSVPMAQYDDEPTNGQSTLQDDKLAAAKNLVFSNGGYPLIVFFASTVLMIAAASACSSASYCGGKFGYAVAAGVISMVVSFAYLWLERQDHLEPRTRIGITVFLFLWWVLVAGITTFDAPFRTPGNGYFAAWGGMLGSLYMLTNEFGKVRETMDRFAEVGRQLAVLLVGSLVVLFSGVAYCSGSGCTGLGGYAIAAGTISFVAAAIRVGVEQKLPANGTKFYNLFFIVFWIVGFIILTFVGPFTLVGNGYFGTWACLIASFLLYKR